MSPTLDAGLRSWPFDPSLLITLLVCAGIYVRGWLALHRRDPQRWHGGQLTAFLGGLTIIYLALASPIEPFASLLLQIHMLQHLLLMMVAPPLLWLGAPLIPWLRGLPRAVRVFWAIPLLSAALVRSLFGGLVHPLTALLWFSTATWFWHAPPVYDLALRSSGWHYLQHVCFLGTALVFWYPIVRPYPARPQWSSWLLLPVLLFADLSNTVLSALLTFSDRVLYPLLCGDSTPWRHVRRGRPIGGWCPHVDSWVIRVPTTPVRYRHPAAVRPRNRGNEGTTG